MLYLEKLNNEATWKIALWWASEKVNIVWYTYEPIPNLTFDDNPIIYEWKVIKFTDHPDYDKIIRESRAILAKDEKQLADVYDYIVNITTENKKKKATVIPRNTNDETELDIDRGDRWFFSLQEAEEYANAFNS